MTRAALAAVAAVGLSACGGGGETWSAHGPVWSPDGRTIAYVRVDEGRLPNSATDELWLVRAAGGEGRKLVEGSLPAWSPEGKRIAYTSFVRARPEVWVVDVATGRRMPVGVGWGPAWSTDGRRLAWIEGRPAKAGAVVLSEAERIAPLRAKLARPDGRIGWVDDRTIAYAQDSTVATVDIETFNPRVVFDVGVESAAARGARIAALAPRGGRAAFVGRADAASTLFVVDERRRRRLGKSRMLTDVAWTPDSRRVSYTIARPDGAVVVAVYDVETGARRVLRRGRGAAWSPNGRLVAYVEDGSVFVARADGSAPRKLAG